MHTKEESKDFHSFEAGHRRKKHLQEVSPSKDARGDRVFVDVFRPLLCIAYGEGKLKFEGRSPHPKFRLVNCFVVSYIFRLSVPMAYEILDQKL